MLLLAPLLVQLLLPSTLEPLAAIRALLGETPATGPASATRITAVALILVTAALPLTLAQCLERFFFFTDLLLNQVDFPLCLILVFDSLGLFETITEDHLALHIIQLFNHCLVIFVLVQVLWIITKFY